MFTLQKFFLSFKQKCEEIITLTESSLQKKKPIWIEVSSSKDSPKYYWAFICKKSHKKKRKYIPASERTMVQAFFQRSYLNQMNSLAKKLLKIINKFLSLYSEDIFESVYENLHPHKKRLVTPIIESHQQFIEKWLQKSFVKKPFREDSRVIKTKDGHRVRSKTERTLYELFQSFNLPFKYECPLRLGTTTIYPDFTFVHPYEKTEIYWEHFGMMDNPEYAVNACNRIIEYEKNGFSLGKNLIISFEDSMNDLDYDWVHLQIKKYLLREKMEI